ncbi:hypothetical protein CMI42_02095 [Candidatus Pacearchaeota archaeon]|nr:hypothetical protein [Candidatus Pacearchaeota archaeon]|tara:strand:+ start:445 stop:1311 length:867 start_codon:yes stop_codon:yes gene_type:complete
MTNRRIRFDGKHWIGKKFYNDPLQISSSDYVARQVRKGLGEGGMVAIPEARPDDDRYEDVVNGLSDFRAIGGENRVMHDTENDVYFIKAQEVNTRIYDHPLTFLAYGLPIGVEGNLDDKEGWNMLEEAKDKNAIVGINGPSCVNSLNKMNSDYREEILRRVDFFVSYSGSATVKLGTNDKAWEFYLKKIRDHKEVGEVGTIAVSGGHRTPKWPLEYVLNGFRQTIGSSNVEINEPNEDNFIEDLRRSLRRSSLEDLTMNPIIAEMVLRHLPSIMIWDRFRKKRKIKNV